VTDLNLPARGSPRETLLLALDAVGPAGGSLAVLSGYAAPGGEKPVTIRDLDEELARMIIDGLARGDDAGTWRLTEIGAAVIDALPTPRLLTLVFTKTSTGDWEARFGEMPEVHAGGNTGEEAEDKAHAMARSLAADLQASGRRIPAALRLAGPTLPFTRRFL
jgi:predicted RNase H-like HicB family nuclease